MPYKATVKVSFKDKQGKAGPKDKRYGAKKEHEFYSSLDEAKTDLGERNALNFINEQLKLNFAAALRLKLMAKVLGDDSPTADLEEIDLDD